MYGDRAGRVPEGREEIRRFLDDIGPDALGRFRTLYFAAATLSGAAVLTAIGGDAPALTAGLIGALLGLDLVVWLIAPGWELTRARVLLRVLGIEPTDSRIRAAAGAVVAGHLLLSAAVLILGLGRADLPPLDDLEVPILLAIVLAGGLMTTFAGPIGRATARYNACIFGATFVSRDLSVAATGTVGLAWVVLGLLLLVDTLSGGA